MAISFGCGNDCDPKHTKSTYCDGKGILLSYDTTRQHINLDTFSGPFVLFKHFRFSERCEHVYDADWVESLYFAIPDSLTEFKLMDSAIYRSNCYYERSAAWTYNQEVVDKGIIEGNKFANGDWRINVDIVVNEPDIFPAGTVKRLKFESLFPR
mgnify:CR=1 FL=1